METKQMLFCPHAAILQHCNVCEQHIVEYGGIERDKINQSCGFADETKKTILEPNGTSNVEMNFLAGCARKNIGGTIIPKR